MDNIFIETICKTTLRCNASTLSKNIDDNLLKLLKQMYEGKCNKDGYIMEDSISIIKRSLPYIYGSQMNSNIKYNIIYKANICCPMTDNVIKCKIDSISKMGLVCIKHPLKIVVAKELHKNKDILKNLKEDDNIEIKIIGKKFNLNDKTIMVVAILNSDNKQDDIESDVDDEPDIENESDIDDALTQDIEYKDDSGTEDGMTTDDSDTTSGDTSDDDIDEHTTDVSGSGSDSDDDDS